MLLVRTAINRAYATLQRELQRGAELTDSYTEYNVMSELSAAGPIVWAALPTAQRDTAVNALLTVPSIRAIVAILRNDTLRNVFCAIILSDSDRHNITRLEFWDKSDRHFVVSVNSGYVSYRGVDGKVRDSYDVDAVFVRVLAEQFAR